MSESPEKARIVAVCVSKHKGTTKTPVTFIDLAVGHGVSGDAHAGDWHRQLSLLGVESIERMRQKGLDVQPGSFAENVTTAGIDLPALPVGTRLRLGRSAVVEITQIGKECHTRCAVYYKAGDCVMPREGIFARILEEGRVEAGDLIEIIRFPGDRS